jgi:hypothetical protein
MSRLIKIYLELEDWEDGLTRSRKNRYGKVIALDMELPSKALDTLVDTLAENTGRTIRKWWDEGE